MKRQAITTTKPNKVPTMVGLLNLSFSYTRKLTSYNDNQVSKVSPPLTSYIKQNSTKKKKKKKERKTFMLSKTPLITTQHILLMDEQFSKVESEKDREHTRHDSIQGFSFGVFLA